MRRTRLGIMVMPVVLATGCGHTGVSAGDYAKSACTAYERTGRVQVATTPEQQAAMMDLARGNAHAAAAFDSRWKPLYADIRAALDERELIQDKNGDQADLYFDIDRRVQEECSDAGRDIGDLEP